MCVCVCVCVCICTERCSQTPAHSSPLQLMILRIVSWTLSNLCRHHFVYTTSEQLELVKPHLSNLIKFCPPLCFTSSPHLPIHLTSLLPPPPHPQAVPSLVYLVQNEDVAVKVDACWALSYLAEGGEMLIQVRM